MKQFKLRHKNRIHNKNFGCGIVLILFWAYQSISLIVKGIFTFFPFNIVLGLLLFIPLVIYLWLSFRKGNKIKKFLKDANDFENNDDWLPIRFKIDMQTIKALDDIREKGFDTVLKGIGNDTLTANIEKDLEFLHEQKRQAELKLKEWNAIPTPSDDEFFNNKKRMQLSGRTAIYSNEERVQIQQDFFVILKDHDDAIAFGNKSLQKIIKKSGDLRRRIDDFSKIDGLNVFDGFYLGQDDQEQLYFFEKHTHILTVAQSGAGKNTSLIMPNLLMDNFDGTKVILDLKGENAAVCSHWKEKEGKGKSLLLNPWHIFDMPTMTYNPFCSLHPFEDDFYNDCTAFADVIIPIKKGQSDTGEHFDELARDFIASFLMYLTIKNYPETPNPVTLYDQIIRATASVKELGFIITDMEGIPHPDENIKRILELSAVTFQGLISTGENNELRGVKTTISRALKPFKSKQLSNAVRSDKENSKALLNTLFHSRENNDLYISFPQSEMNEAKLWLRLVLGSFIRDNTKNKPTKPVLFVLDEFPQLGTFNLVLEGIPYLRSYNIQFWIICQSLDQLTTHYGKEGSQTIIQNCTVSQFFNVKDDTAKYVSEKLDKFSKIVENYNTHEYKSNFERLRKTRAEVEQELGTFTFIGQNEGFLLQRIPYYELDTVKNKAAPNPLFHTMEKYKAYISKNDK